MWVGLDSQNVSVVLEEASGREKKICESVVVVLVVRSCRVRLAGDMIFHRLLTLPLLRLFHVV